MQKKLINEKKEQVIEKAYVDFNSRQVFVYSNKIGEGEPWVLSLAEYRKKYKVNKEWFDL